MATTTDDETGAAAPLPRPVASIVIVNFNAGRHLATCVEALRKQTLEEFEVIVVDNASSDDSLERAVTAADGDVRFTFDEADNNLGFAAGNNRGIVATRGDLIVTLNPDAFPEAEWLANLCSVAGDNPGTAMFGSLQLAADGSDRLDGAGDRYLAAGLPWRDRAPGRLEASRKADRTAFETFSPCAAAAAYRRDAFESVGGFDEAFFCYVEDIDLGFRLRLAGHTCLQVTDARVHHVGGGSSGGELSEFARFHGTRNLIWCFAKNMPGLLLIILLPAHLGALTVLLLRSLGRGQSRTTFRAIAAAWRGLPDIMAQRRRVQRSRVATAWAIACSLDWNPADYLRGRRG